ncbi:MAG: tetratricopeptide repeat protein, partial [Rhodospirillaceae bacterium]|nr:tetratricopeptide repeat protein [Rhodospirillaceae bacterium]
VDLIVRAIEAAPDRPTFPFNLAVTYGAMGELAKAAQAYQTAVDLKSDWPEALVNLGTVLGQLQNYGPAESAFRQALELTPNEGAALIGLTAALDGQGKSAEAEQIGRQAVSVSLKSPEAWTNLGNALNSQASVSGKTLQAEEAFRHALALDPGYVTAHFNLGNVLNDQWRKAEALGCFREALKRDPGYQSAWQNLLMNLLYDPAETEQSIFAAHQEWAKGFADLGPGEIEASDRKESKRLRIGYVSPDFRTHSCAYFLKPLIEAHDSDAFEIFAYANVTREDEATAWFKAHIEHWCDVTVMSDDEMAARISQDGIDILVDLAGHSVNNRLAVFAQKPAPVQMSWLGYPATTGLAAIEYRLTDEIADPVGPADQYHSEQLVRLEGGFHCYLPPNDAPDIGPLPALETGYVTFGSFNHIAKMTQGTIKTWAAILQANPASKLLLKGGMLDYDVVPDRIIDAFQNRGIAKERIILQGWIARDDNPLELYNSIDIGLDTFPFNGTTTSFEALWMGIPIITLKGERHAGRVGASILTHLGHPEWIADTPNVYIDLACSLAGDLEALQKTRAALREELQNSSLGRAEEFAAKIEVVYQNTRREGS